MLYIDKYECCCYLIKLSSTKYAYTYPTYEYTKLHFESIQPPHEYFQHLYGLIQTRHEHIYNPFEPI